MEKLLDKFSVIKILSVLKIYFLLQVSILLLNGCGGVSGGGTSNPASAGGNNINGLSTLVSITITSNSLTTIHPEDTVQFNALGVYADGSTQDLTNSVDWTSSSTDVATINKQGLALAGSTLGTTNIQAATNGIKSNTIPLNVVNPTTKVVSLTISPGSAKIAKDTTQQFEATATYSDGTEINVTSESGTTWTSSNSSVATVDASGLSTGLTKGTATVTAEYKDSQGNTVESQSQLAVTEAEVVAILVSPGKSTLPIGNSEKYAAFAIFSDNTRQDISDQVTWSSSELGVASITGGVAIGVGSGRAIIHARSQNGVIGSALLIITNTAAVLTRIDLSPASASIAKGTTQLFKATGIYSDGSSKTLNSTVSWSSNKYLVATVNKYGLATGKLVGSSIITAKSGSIHAEATLNVTNKVLTKVVVTPLVQSMPVGVSQQYNAVGIYSDGSQQDLTASVTWSSSPDGIVTITSVDNGLVGPGVAIGQIPGSTTIKASQDGVTGEAKLTITPAVLKSIQVSPQEKIIPVEASVSYKAQGIYSDGSSKDITDMVAWNSSNEKVAIVTSDGEATGISSGKPVTISAVSQDGVTGKALLKVTNVVLERIVVSPSVESLPKGLSQQYKATGIYSDNSREDLTTSATWISSDTNVATITSGEAGGLATGEIVGGPVAIFALQGGRTGSAVLTVSSAKLESITITPENYTTPLGINVQYTLTGIYSDKSSRTITSGITWTSTNQSAAIIYSDGVATPLSVDYTDIQAEFGGYLASTKLTVSPGQLEGATIIGPNSVYYTNESQFVLVGTFSNNPESIITSGVSWSSSNTTVASVDSNGKVTATGIGTATVNAMYAGKTYTKNVTVPDLSGVIIVGYDHGVTSGYVENFVNDQFISLLTTDSSNSQYRFLQSVAYNNNATTTNKFSVVGGRTDIPTGRGAFSWYSSDGVSWLPYSLNFYDISWLSDVTYANGIFISVGEATNGTSGYTLRSVDGRDYVVNTKGITPKLLYGVTYGNNKFIAVGANSYITISTDGGFSWSNTGISIKNNNGLDLNSIAYCNNTYVAVGDQGNVMRSSDGLTWTAIKNRTDTATINFSGVACFNNIWVAVGTDSTYGGTIVTSVDGANSWNRGYRPTINPLNRVVYNKGSGGFVVVGDQGTILTAPPLSSSTSVWTWTAVPNPQTDIDWKGITSIQ